MFTKNATVPTLYVGVLVLMLLIPMHVFAGNQSFQIQRSDTDCIDVQFTLPAWHQENVDPKSNQVKVACEGADYLFIGEENTLPVFTTMLAIPYQGEIRAEILNNDTSIHSNVSLKTGSLMMSNAINGNYPGNLINVSSPAMLRDFRVVSLNLYPFQYRPGSQQLTVSQSITVRLHILPSTDLSFERPPVKYSPSFEPLYRSLILNYTQTRDEAIPYQRPTILYIYPTTSDNIFLTKLNNLVNWKRQKGFVVETRSTDQTGTSNSAIQSYIRTAYSTWADPPEYVVIIGDVSGTFTIPTFSDNTLYGSYNAEGDYRYSWMNTGDELGDVFIGRISISSTADFGVYVAKELSLEKNINLNNADWVNRMLLVGDTNTQSGISPVYTNQYIHEISYNANNQYTYTEMYMDSPSASAVNTALINGVSFFNYRGWIGMSGWTTTNISALTNGAKLFHAVIITCDTGTFSGTARTEALIRKGTESELGGAITAIGMSTSGTHTAFNNCLAGGIFDGIYTWGMRDMGQALLYSKLYLSSVYNVANPNLTKFFALICNLMGDPSAVIYIGIPKQFSVTAPTSIVAGCPYVDVTVNDLGSGLPVANAVVSVQGTNCDVAIATNSLGRAVVPIASNLSGELTLTVSRDGYKPSISSVAINSAGGLVYDYCIIDDDNTGGTSGNNNGLINSNELIDYKPLLRNTTTSTISGISATLSCTDTYVTVSSGSLSYPNASPGVTVTPTTAARISFRADCPDNHSLLLNVTGTSSAGQFSFSIPVTVRCADLDYTSYGFIGNANNVLDIGETSQFTVTFTNNGSISATGISAVLRSLSPLVTVVDSVGTYGTMANGSAVTNTSDPYQITAQAQCYNGMLIPMQVKLYNRDGYIEYENFNLTIGQSTVTDPLGQDTYGYFIFDDGDTGYSACPTYNWIPIAPGEGGTGTALAITDNGTTSDEGDQVGCDALEVVTLPFNIKFYGKTYSQITVMSNGFIALGVSNNPDFRNWHLPGPLGPNPMIAAFWDDLSTTGGGIYTYYSSANHYFVVEWYNMKNGYNQSSIETFQVIIYDPLYYVTGTGDGPIKIQYKVFNNVDSYSGTSTNHGKYCTVGIKDHTGKVGLEYTFNNQYPTAAKPLTSLSAILITTRPLLPNSPYLETAQVNLYDANGNSMLEPSESANIFVSVRNTGYATATSVTGTLTSTDPLVTINTSTATYGNITVGSIATPSNNYSITVSPNAPLGYQVSLTLTLSANGNTWSCPITYSVYTPDLHYGTYTVTDPSGNNNGLIEAGELINILIPVNNTGLVNALNAVGTLSTTDPYVTINNSTVQYGTINTSATVTPPSSYTFTVAANVPMNHQIQLTLTLTSSTSSNVYQIPLDVSTPNFSLGIPLISDLTGNNNSSLDPGETVTIVIPLRNTGLVSSVAGNAVLSTTTPGITIGLGSTGFNAIPSNGSANLSYSITASSSMSIGTIVDLFVHVVAGGFVADLTTSVEIGAPMEVTIGTEASTQRFPIDRYYNYSAHESIYLASDIALAGNIRSLAFYKASGTDVNPISSVSIYMKHTDNSSLVTGDYSLTGYTLVYSGSYPNTAESGWMEVNLNSMFDYNGISNLSILIIKGYEPYINNYPMWTYTTVSSTQARLGYSDSAAPTNLTATNYLPNMRLKIFAVQIAYPPRNLVATAANRIVSLTWQTPISGLPSSYNIYRNSVLFANETELFFNDVDVVNGTTYSYFVKAVYNGEESAATLTVQATPNTTTSSFATIGTEGTTTNNNYASPINITYKSSHGQSIYTAAELNAAGVYGPIQITQLGFYIVSAPNLALPNFIIRMKHTTATDVSNWQTAANMVTVYSNTSYMPVIGGYQMLTLSTPFTWNGTDNIVLDTAFGLVSAWSQTGTVQYNPVNNSYHYTWSDTVDQTNVFTGGTVVARRPIIKIAVQVQDQGAVISVNNNTLNFGSVAIGSSANLQLTIHNTGSQLLAGYFTLPTGFSIAAVRTSSSKLTIEDDDEDDRNALRFSIASNGSKTFQVTFTPTSAVAYSGNLTITSNASNNQSLNVALSGTGFLPSLAVPTLSIEKTESGIYLHWNAIAGADVYKVYKSSTPNGPFTLIGSTSSLQYSVTGDDIAFYYIKAATVSARD